jgi:hypothetical protein
LYLDQDVKIEHAPDNSMSCHKKVVDEWGLY